MQQHCGSNIRPVSGSLKREESRWNTRPSYIQYDILPTKIQIQRQQHCGLKTRPSYIQSDLLMVEDRNIIVIEIIVHILRLGEIAILKSALNNEEMAMK